MKPWEHITHKKAPAFTNYIQYKGVWDMQDLIEFMVSFFSQRKYKIHELKHILKHPSPFGVDIKNMWHATRDIEEYYKAVFDIYIHQTDVHDIEVVMKDGEKRTFTKGKLWVQFVAKVETDYQGKFEEKAFWLNVRNFYHRYVLWKKIEAGWWDDMYYNVFLKLIALFKERLKMESEGQEHRYFNKVR